MTKELAYYRIFPSVVPADETSEIEIRCLEPSYSFAEGVTYAAEFLPMSYPLEPFHEEYNLLDYTRSRRRVEAVAQNGVLRLAYHFSGEQKWTVRVFAIHSRQQDERVMRLAEEGMTLQMYSVKQGLYGLQPYYYVSFKTLHYGKRMIE